MKNAMLVFLCCSVAAAQEPYRKPAQAVLDVLHAPVTPSVSLSSSRDCYILMDYDAYPPLAALAQPMLKLAGVRLNPETNGQHQIHFVQRMTLQRLAGGPKIPIRTPPGANLGAPRWSPDGKHFVFTNTTAHGIQVWVADTASGQARVLPGIRLNDVLGSEMEWLSDHHTLLLKTVPSGRTGPPAASPVPKGPNVLQASGKTASSTYEVRDVLKNGHDAELFDYYASAQLVTVDIKNGQVRKIGAPALLDTVEAAPDGQHILVERIHRPYSYLHPYQRFPREVEIWDRSGKVVKKLASLPLFDQVPLEGVASGPRDYEWSATEPATLLWVEALDGGDSRKKVPQHDQLMRWTAPFQGEPSQLARTEWRYQGMTQGEDGRFLLYEYDWERRQRRVWLHEGAVAPRLLWDLNVAERYKNPGYPVTRLLANGRRVLHQDGDTIYLAGQGASAKGDRPFLDKFDLKTLQSERIFWCDGQSLESFAAWLDSKAGRFITRRESPIEPPNFFVHEGSQRKPLTAFPDPTPQLRGVSKRLITYQRKDGTPLSMTLYLPPGYQEGTRLPTILWAYPLEFSNSALAGQVSGSERTFVRIGGTSPVFFALQGYAVLDNVAMPVIGPPETVYDSFIEQIVADSQAAIDKAVELGVTDRRRVGVAGHSHGALMTANLLAHCDLFRAGCARSGAYNHTLRPFGFQSEKRTLYQAPANYLKLSPLVHADQINEPLLLIHGEADANPGTVPLQSQKLYEAVAGVGGTVRLVMLPLESHGYEARESVEQTLFEMISWFDKYVKNATP